LACGFSLKKFGVDASAIPKEMSVVDNGILYGFNLQKDGFLSITL
jgi:intracellular sulfur oxidation DsrE/DsrF family protein